MLFRSTLEHYQYLFEQTQFARWLLNSLIIGVTALAGTSVYLAAGLIDPGLAAPVILGVTTGAFLGTRLLVRLTNEAVRRVFLGVLIVLAAEMIVRGIRG